MPAIKSISDLQKEHDCVVDAVLQEYEQSCLSIAEESKQRIESLKDDPLKLEEVLDWEKHELEKAFSILKEKLHQSKREFFSGVELYAKTVTESRKLEDFDSQLKKI